MRDTFLACLSAVFVMQCVAFCVGYTFQVWRNRKIREAYEALTKTPQAGPIPSSGIILPGWDCPSCGAFNGSMKECLKRCRCCDYPSGDP